MNDEPVNDQERSGTGTVCRADVLATGPPPPDQPVSLDSRPATTPGSGEAAGRGAVRIQICEQHDRCCLPAGSSPGSGSVDVSIIIPVVTARYLPECLESIKRCTPDIFHRVILINDGSSEPELLEFLSCAEHRVVVQDHNRGFAAACNAGFTAAADGSEPAPRYLATLNADTQVAPGWLRTLLDMLESDPDLAVVGPTILDFPASEPDADAAWRRSRPSGIEASVEYPATEGPRPGNPAGGIQQAGCTWDGTGRIQQAGCTWDGTGFHTDLSGIDTSTIPGVPSRYCEAVGGMCMVFRPAPLFEAGLFDEKYANSCEDMAICLALREFGYRVAVCGNSFVYHQGGSSKYTSASTDLDSSHLRFSLDWTEARLASLPPASAIRRVNLIGAFSGEWRAEHHVAAALEELGIKVNRFDHRKGETPHATAVLADLSLVLRGDGIPADLIARLPKPTVLWYSELLPPPGECLGVAAEGASDGPAGQVTASSGPDLQAAGGFGSLTGAAAAAESLNEAAPAVPCGPRLSGEAESGGGSPCSSSQASESPRFSSVGWLQSPASGPENGQEARALDNLLTLTANLRAFDFVVTHDDTAAQTLRNAGASHVICVPGSGGVNPAINKKLAVEKLYDVGFYGSVSLRRKHILTRLAPHGIAVKVADVWGEEMNRFINECRICLNIHETDRLNTESRVAEVLGAGTFCLSEEISMPDLYEDGEHLAYWSSGDVDDLAAKIHYYLESSSERERIAAQGHRLACERDTYVNRCRSILSAASQSFSYLLGYHLGIPLDKGGKPTLDLNEFGKAVEMAVSPDYPFSHLQRGNLALRYGDAEGAAAWHRRALALDPTFVEAKYGLALALFRAGKDEEALAYWSALPQDRYPDALRMMAVLYRRLGRLQDATRCLEQYLKLHPGAADAGSSRQELNRLRGELDRLRQEGCR